jgi:hypothetical protein
MYASQDALFQLINKLTPKERKDFLKELKQGSGANGKTNYQRLFELLSVMEHYDEAIVKLKLKKHMTDQVFSVVKNKLYERLLDYLKANLQTIHKKLHTWLEYVEVLIARQLYDEAAVYCEKVKKEAKQYGYLYLITQANYWKGGILQYINNEKFDVVVSEFLEEGRKNTELIRLNMKIGTFYQDVGFLVHQDANIRNEEFNQKILALKKDECFALDARDESYTFYMACYLAMGKNMIYKFTGEFEEAYLQEKIVWDLLKADWAFHYKTKPKEIVSATVNYMEALSTTEHVKEYREHMDFAEDLLAGDMKGNTYLQSAVMLFRLNDLVNTKKESITAADMAPFISFYKSATLSLYVDIKKHFELYIARAFFYMGDYKKAQHYLVILINDYKRTEILFSYYEYALFMDLLNEVTMQFQTSFESAVKDMSGRAKHYHEHIRRRIKDDYSFENLFLKFFASIDNDSSRQEVLAKIDKLEEWLSFLFSENTAYLRYMQINFDTKVILNRWRHHITQRSQKAK